MIKKEFKADWLAQACGASWTSGGSSMGSASCRGGACCALRTASDALRDVLAVIMELAVILDLAALAVIVELLVVISNAVAFTVAKP